MKDYDLANVEVVLFDPSPGMRRTIREALFAVGFHSLNDSSKIDMVRGAIDSVNPDLLLLEIDENQEEIRSIITDVRRGELSSNPFTIIIVLTWHALGEIVSGTMDAGPDDVVVMPISVQVLSNRIDNMIRHRKDFVATPNYIGPDRRKSVKADEDELGTFSVPNSLRYKATGDLSAAVDRSALKNSAKSVNEHMLYGLATRVNELASEMERFASRSGRPNLPTAVVDELLDLLDRITHHLEAHGHHKLVELASSTNGVIDRIMNSPELDRRLFELLGLHGKAIVAALQGEEENSDAVVSALNAAMSQIDRRGKEASKRSAESRRAQAPNSRPSSR